MRHRSGITEARCARAFSDKGEAVARGMTDSASADGVSGRDYRNQSRAFSAGRRASLEYRHRPGSNEATTPAERWRPRHATANNKVGPAAQGRRNQQAANAHPPHFAWRDFLFADHQLPSRFKSVRVIDLR
jgi:hypothetical protein